MLGSMVAYRDSFRPLGEEIALADARDGIEIEAALRVRGQPARAPMNISAAAVREPLASALPTISTLRAACAATTARCRCSTQVHQRCSQLPPAYLIRRREQPADPDAIPVVPSSPDLARHAPDRAYLADQADGVAVSLQEAMMQNEFDFTVIDALYATGYHGPRALDKPEFYWRSMLARWSRIATAFARSARRSRRPTRATASRSARCEYEGSRFHHALPMNISSLRQFANHWHLVLPTISTLRDIAACAATTARCRCST